LLAAAGGFLKPISILLCNNENTKKKRKKKEQGTEWLNTVIKYSKNTFSFPFWSTSSADKQIYEYKHNL
jgi:hypothetical protein